MSCLLRAQHPTSGLPSTPEVAQRRIDVGGESNDHPTSVALCFAAESRIENDIKNARAIYFFDRKSDDRRATLAILVE
jgi:hypothetical protein